MPFDDPRNKKWREKVRRSVISRKTHAECDTCTLVLVLVCTIHFQFCLGFDDTEDMMFTWKIEKLGYSYPSIHDTN